MRSRRENKPQPNEQQQQSSSQRGKNPDQQGSRNPQGQAGALSGRRGNQRASIRSGYGDRDA